MFEIQDYLTADGQDPYAKWLAHWQDWQTEASRHEIHQDTRKPTAR